MDRVPHERGVVLKGRNSPTLAYLNVAGNGANENADHLAVHASPNGSSMDTGSKSVKAAEVATGIV